MSRNTVLALVVLLAVSLASPEAVAGFQFTSNRTTVGAKDVIVFYALNDGVTSGKKLQAFDATLSTPSDAGQHFAIELRDVALQGGQLDGVADANVTGVGLSFGSPVGTFMRIGNAGGWNDVYGAPNPYNTWSYSGAYGTQAIDVFAAAALWTTLGTSGNDLKVAATIPLNLDYMDGMVATLNIAGFPSTAPDASVTPQPFAQAVVPLGMRVRCEGAVGGDIGEPFNFSIDNVPEPTALGLLALLPLLMRRR